MLDAVVLPQPRNKNMIPPRGVRGSGEVFVFAGNLDARKVPQRAYGVADLDGLFKFHMRGDGVRDRDRHTHAGDLDAQFGQSEDFPCFHLHFPFFARVAGVEEGVNLRDHIRGEAAREFAVFRGTLVLQVVLLLVQFLESRVAGARRGLVCVGDDADEGRELQQRLERHDELNRGAVRVGDDIFRRADVVSVDFGDDERRVGVHSEVRGVINDGAVLGGARRVFGGDFFTRREEREPALGEVEFREVLDGCRLSVGADDFALRARRGDGYGARGEFALLQHADDFSADGAGRADDGDIREAGHAEMVVYFLSVVKYFL